ncbi:DUF695 domain-containing protein [Ralstonia sp. SM1864_UCD524_TZ4]|uniref:DUF695 domain-containing protein n=1 Tax=Ralstonia solanacearum TaxID=305 RepID=A0A0S4UL11_RALSL|nr:DUF695 domain-containing protein [Ralstonia pseudosolanacearum]CUV22911.1 conserved protein of unknown function [Ralstonia solanacearum]CUV36798.1 conserved protein of unknown function [Ralstonia solanacearum]CUV40622.1 conserved protein of unknown function [Ralstonia solanacearum]CUV64078.1 conserved protein of unknown function [Ralstonia solanacearum]
MADAWELFPAQMGEHRAFISFNSSFAEIAEQDPRMSLLRVRVELKQPTPEGMPGEDEFQELKKVEDLLTTAVEAGGGVQVGRLTVRGHRHFYFYVAFAEEKAQGIVDAVGPQVVYELAYAYQQDPEKEGYWKYLYPTADDWQVIRDSRVLNVLTEKGDISSVGRNVAHWAYFPKSESAEQFADWAKKCAYAVNSIASTDDNKTVVRFTHEGTMELEDITHHTIAINRKVREFGGDYDGWETTIERGTS